MHEAAADRDVSAALLARCRTFRRCRNAILDLGDSEAAADFYGETALFLIDTYPAGPVAIGFVTGPIGANSWGAFIRNTHFTCPFGQAWIGCRVGPDEAFRDALAPAFRGKRPESPPLRPPARADWATQKTLVSFSPDNVHETGVSPGGRSGSPSTPPRPKRVERTRRETWSRGPIRPSLCPYRVAGDLRARGGNSSR
jgi:hypothetical protein